MRRDRSKRVGRLLSGDGSSSGQCTSLVSGGASGTAGGHTPLRPASPPWPRARARSPKVNSGVRFSSEVFKRVVEGAGQSMVARRGELSRGRLVNLSDRRKACPYLDWLRGMDSGPSPSLGLGFAPGGAHLGASLLLRTPAVLAACRTGTRLGSASNPCRPRNRRSTGREDLLIFGLATLYDLVRTYFERLN